MTELIEAERLSTAAALTANGRLNCTLTLECVDEEHLGAFLQCMEFQTAFMGALLEYMRARREAYSSPPPLTAGVLLPRFLL